MSSPDRGEVWLVDLKRHGVSDEVIHEALSEVAHGS